MKTSVPAEYANLHRMLETRKISFGYSGIELVALEDIPDAQRGYSIIPDGVTTDWNVSWLVVGHDTSLGDPLFIDVSKEALPVFTAPHGEGTWSPRMIAPSAKAFFDILSRLASLAKERKDAEALETNPLSDAEREEFLEHVAKYFDDDAPAFWGILVDTDS